MLESDAPLDPPSPQLVQRLIGSGLCRPRDLSRCRARVRRLARDIPTFETVWLDALVQTRKLTAFQADVLGSDTPDRLSVGPFLLLNSAGDDGRFEHFQARRRDSAAPFLLSRPRGELDSPVAAEERLRTFLTRTSSVVHPGLASLLGFESVNGQMWVASPWTTGSTLQHLLVRRGRFSARCAVSVVLQMCEALAALESVGCLHGDVRPRNAVLTARGQAVLILPGLRTALYPERSIHADVPPDDCDGVAPELIDVGQSPTMASDMYSLGCLLWELLAGRPPFPHGDPLAKLAAHRSQTIPDVQEWAPDTPALLVELIAQLTSKSPAMRPQSFGEVSSRLLQIGRASRRELSRAMQGADAALPIDTTRRDAPSGGPKALAAGILLLAAGAVVLMMPGARAELLSIAQRNTSSTAASEVATDESNNEARVVNRVPLPAPDADGVIQLSGPGPYAPRDIATDHRLIIRGPTRQLAVVLIGEQPLRVQAERLILENVELRREQTGAASISDGPSHLLQLQALEFAMRRCLLDNGGQTPQATVAWSLPASSAASATKGAVIIKQTVFVGGGPAVQVRGLLSQATFDNVLHCGSRALLELSAPDAAWGAVDVVARRVTLRGASPAVDVRLSTGSRFPRSLTLTLEDSVAELDRAALIEFSGHAAPNDWTRRLQITGESSIVPPGAEIVGLRVGPERRRALPIEGVLIEGLLGAEFSFAGPPGLIPDDSVMTGFAGYGRSARPPGIDPTGLPARATEAYNSTTDRPSRADTARPAARTDRARQAAGGPANSVRNPPLGTQP